MNGSFVRFAIAGLLAGCAHTETATVTMPPAPKVAVHAQTSGALPQPSTSVAPAGTAEDSIGAAKLSCGAKP